MDSTSQGQDNLVSLTSDIVAAYVSNNTVNPAEISSLIASIHQTLNGIVTGAMGPKEEPAPTPAVPVRKSINPDYIICLEDGKRFKSLKRHLRTKYNLSPEDYRARWNLPADYPMVAPNYAEARSNLAKQMGLGQQRRKNMPAPAPAKKTTKRKAEEAA
jgi:predicted transcriptional regulator